MPVDRKALTRSYKESRRPMGVYRIRHLRSGRALIGRSVDLPSVFNRERLQLRIGGHPNRALQQDWNADGADSFAFEVLDTLEWPENAPGYDPQDDLRTLEKMWRERLQTAEAAYYDERRRT